MRVDAVEEWATLAITYDLPAAPPLPESQAGTPQRSAMDGAREGGDVDVRLVVEAPPPPAPEPPRAEAPPTTAVETALLAAGADTTPVTRGGTTAEQMAGYMGCAENQRLIAAASAR